MLDLGMQRCCCLLPRLLQTHLATAIPEGGGELMGLRRGSGGAVDGVRPQKEIHFIRSSGFFYGLTPPPRISPLWLCQLREYPPADPHDPSRGRLSPGDSTRIARGSTGVVLCLHPSGHHSVLAAPPDKKRNGGSFLLIARNKPLLLCKLQKNPGLRTMRHGKTSLWTSSARYDKL